MTITDTPTEPEVAEVIAALSLAGATELSLVVRRLAFQRDALLQDQKRLEYVLSNHLKAHSPHMDNTFGFSFRGLLNGLHRNGRDAIDAAIFFNKGR